MSSITIRNIDPQLKERLRKRAAENGHSMEAEARHILQGALDPSSAYGRQPIRTHPLSLCSTGWRRDRAAAAPVGAQAAQF
jgi:hypothetical protein